MMDALTHMPFLTYSNAGERVLLFAQADNADTPLWKLFYRIDNRDIKRLETGLSGDSLECSPTAWQDESGWHVSFVALDSSGVYRLYRMDGPTLNTLSTPVSLRLARTGFVHKDRLAVGEIQDLVHVHDSDGDHRIELPGTFIYRVSYRADSPNKLLISGDWIGEDEEPFTVEYDLESDMQRFIECDGHGAYKCTIYGDEILYAERTGRGFEERHLRTSKAIRGVCCQMAHRHRDAVSETQLKVSKKCGCRRNAKDDAVDHPARPSCLECCEKHLGAAFVLLSEVQDGYSYRLRLIGHLHEAEDESQEWPALHNVIRQARKNYQRENTTPDWEFLAQQVEEARNAR